MRVALHTRVRGDRVEEYERAHAAVPAQLTVAIRAAGVTGWTIWRSGTDLFHVIDCADYGAMLAALNAMGPPLLVEEGVPTVFPLAGLSL